MKTEEYEHFNSVSAEAVGLEKMAEFVA